MVSPHDPALTEIGAHVGAAGIEDVDAARPVGVDDEIGVECPDGVGLSVAVVVGGSEAVPIRHGVSFFRA